MGLFFPYILTKKSTNIPCMTSQWPVFLKQIFSLSLQELTWKSAMHNKNRRHLHHYIHVVFDVFISLSTNQYLRQMSQCFQIFYILVFRLNCLCVIVRTCFGKGYQWLINVFYFFFGLTFLWQNLHVPQSLQLITFTSWHIIRRWEGC